MIDLFKQSPIIPVLTLHNQDQALKLAEILITNGLTNLEVTLRTKSSLACIAAIAREFPEVNVGAGTIIYPEQFSQIKDMGAKFAVSPGCNQQLITAAKNHAMPYLPGASTPSEIINLLAEGFKLQKFFHANNSGGIKMLLAYASIFSAVKFCPTGGINHNNFNDYLQLNNVVCIGGSWLVDVGTMDYQQITKVVRNVAAILAN